MNKRDIVAPAFLGDWRLLSVDHTYDGDAWIRLWAPRRCGYVQLLDAAGIYRREELLAEPDYFDRPNIIALPVYLAARISRAGRTLDGAGDALPNATGVWRQANEAALWCRVGRRYPRRGAR